MAQYLISESYLTNIADAIRGKLNVTTLYTPGEMGRAINSIPVATTPVLQTKTITPDKTIQIIEPDSPNIGFSSITVNAIPDNYIIPNGNIEITKNGTNIDVKNYATASINVPTSGGTTINNQNKTVIPSMSEQIITADSGYTGLGTVTVDAIEEGTVIAPSTISGNSATLSTGTNTITLTKTISITPNVTAVGYISEGTASNASVSLTASITTKAATTYRASTSNQTIAAGTYLTGVQTIAAVSQTNLSAANIKAGTTISISNGQSNIWSITGTFTSDANAIAADLNNGKIAYVNGNKITGTQVINKYYTGTSAPSSSLGSNGDIYLQE